MPTDDESHDRLTQVIGWALDHCAAEVNLDSELVVVGDPEVLWSAPPLSADALGGQEWAAVDLPAGRVLCLRGDVGDDGPWMFVTTTSDGPLEQVTLQPSIRTDAATERDAGWVTLTSGRLVVGEPGTVHAWGPAVDVDDDSIAQSRTGFDYPEQRYVGLIVVVRTPAVERCRVVLSATAAGGLHALSLRPPIPRWTPPILKP